MHECMLSGAKYAHKLKAYAPEKVACPHCGMQTCSSNQAYSFCNFCEQLVDVAKSIPEHEKTSQAAFVPVAELLLSKNWDGALAAADTLMKGNTDPEQLYLLGTFYSGISGIRYRKRDYELEGFMEANADMIRSSLDLTSKAKECFFKAIKCVVGAQADGASADTSLLFIKFMCEMRLRRLPDALTALDELRKSDTGNSFINYAYAVYGVETLAKDVDRVLANMLENNEPNSFYYLARYLAGHKKLGEASELLQVLVGIARMPLADELLYEVRQAQEAAAM